jgi:CheY-like chemotaxis protein
MNVLNIRHVEDSTYDAELVEQAFDLILADYLIFLDRHLPDMSGEDVLRLLSGSPSPHASRCPRK